MIIIWQLTLIHRSKTLVNQKSLKKLSDTAWKRGGIDQGNYLKSSSKWKWDIH